VAGQELDQGQGDQQQLGQQQDGLAGGSAASRSMFGVSIGPP